jgi:hypothetical protein
MTHFSQPRELKPNERAMIEFLLTADFPGRDELREQVGCVGVVWDCDCGCGTIKMIVRNPVVRAVAREPIPVEARGAGIDVLLFVRDGLLASLEIVDHGNSRPLTYPSPSKLELWVPPALK